jgi:hypothetical protein
VSCDAGFFVLSCDSDVKERREQTSSLGSCLIVIFLPLSIFRKHDETDCEALALFILQLLLANTTTIERNECLI